VGRCARDLKRDSMLWRLQVNCLRYCSFVHSHHNAEDADFVSELRDTNPAINPVIDRLQADHRRVADDLEAVETAANRLTEHDGREARQLSSTPCRLSARTCSPISNSKSSTSK
jgi:hypothetical protein